MSTPKRSASAIVPVLLGSALVAVACGGKAVVDPPGGSGGSGGTSSGTTSGTGGTGTGGTGTGNAGATDPGATDGIVISDESQTTLSLASFSITCTNVDPPLPAECGWWLLDIRMPTDMLVPGPLDFDDPLVDGSSMSTTADPTDPNLCSGSGGTFMGTVVIDGVTGSEVDLTVSNTSSWEIPAGSYTAARCM